MFLERRLGNAGLVTQPGEIHVIRQRIREVGILGRVKIPYPKMAALTKGAFSAKEIVEWHRKNLPVWKQEKLTKGARPSKAGNAPQATSMERKLAPDKPK